MLVTLFVDASYYHDTSAAAYALYAVSEKDKFTYAGRFKQPISNSTHAELAAIANALSIILPHRVSAGASRVLIQSDSKGAIKWLQERTGKKHPEVIDHVLRQAAKYDVKLEYRFIKGHQGRTAPREYCHDWCDRESRRIAKRMHDERFRQISGLSI